MTVIAVASAKGSPGVSLATKGFVHCWPRPIVGMEFDESGGTWAYRHGLTCEPGLASLAATQQPLDQSLVAEHGQMVGESKWMVCAPKEGTIVRAAVGWLSDRVLAWPDAGDLVLDVGRVQPGEMARSAALRRADLVALMTGTRAEELAAAASVVAELAATLRAGARVHLLFVASGPYGADEAADALNGLVKRHLFRIAGTIPFDPKAASELRDGGRRASKVCERWFGQIASELAAATAHRTTATPAAQPAAAAMNGAH